MQIKSILTNKAGKTFEVFYNDIESEPIDKKISGVHAYCFYGDKLVVVYSEKKGYWTPPGGGVEEGEKASEAIIREVKEETNMNVLAQRFIGCQDLTELDGSITSQTRSVCLVEPCGKFISDPDNGEITEIKLIDPEDYKHYFDWKEIGDHIMKRALQIKNQMQSGFDNVE